MTSIKPSPCYFYFLVLNKRYKPIKINITGTKYIFTYDFIILNNPKLMRILLTRARIPNTTSPHPIISQKLFFES